MSDRSTDPPASSGTPERSLSEILEELAQLSHAHQGEASEMRGAVSELSRALARLFEMIRTDRHEQREQIARLERELAATRQQLAQLGGQALVAPAPNDFDQLRAAAERLRARTEQLVRDAGNEVLADVAAAASENGASAPEVADEIDVADERAAALGDAPGDDHDAAAHDAPAAAAESVGVPRLRVLDGDASAGAPQAEGQPAAPEQADEQRAAASDEAALEDLDVECELPVTRAASATATLAPDAAGDELPAGDDPPAPAHATVARSEPIAIEPRPARRRPWRIGRRRLDARKLSEVEAATALGSMVALVDPAWTSGHRLDLVVAFTDGGALRIAGGDREPLRVTEVPPGEPARCTITATRRQLVPLFGRLELTGDDSAPLIHGNRRDADALVGWLDRAQRLTAEPL